MFTMSILGNAVDSNGDGVSPSVSMENLRNGRSEDGSSEVGYYCVTGMEGEVDDWIVVHADGTDVLVKYGGDNVVKKDIVVKDYGQSTDVVVEKVADSTYRLRRVGGGKFLCRLYVNAGSWLDGESGDRLLVERVVDDEVVLEFKANGRYDAKCYCVDSDMYVEKEMTRTIAIGSYVAGKCGEKEVNLWSRVLETDFSRNDRVVERARHSRMVDVVKRDVVVEGVLKEIMVL